MLNALNMLYNNIRHTVARPIPMLISLWRFPPAKPCEPLVVPGNGAIACNGWNGRFGEVCTVLCQQYWDLPLGKDISRVFVCGASGHWIPNMGITACSGNCTVSSSFYYGTAMDNLRYVTYILYDGYHPSSYVFVCVICTYCYKPNIAHTDVSI